MNAYDPTTGMPSDTSAIGATDPRPSGLSDPLAGSTMTTGGSPDGAGATGTMSPATDQDGQGIGQTARQVAEGVAAAAGDVTARLPEVAETARGAWEEADRLVHRGSDSTLQLVGAASVGFAVGLLVGGAHRLLVILSLIPAGLIAATVLERMERGDTWSEVLDSDSLVQGG